VHIFLLLFQKYIPLILRNVKTNLSIYKFVTSVEKMCNYF